MKNKQKGFIIPLLIAIVVIASVGGGVYVYHEKKSNDRLVASSSQEVIATTSVNGVGALSSSSVKTQTKVTDNSIKSTNKIAFQATSTLGIKDCGSDINCFSAAILTCSPAKVTYTNTLSIENIFKQTSTSYSELKPSSGLCTIYSKLLNNKIEHLTPIDQATLDAEAFSNKSIIGHDGTCTISNKSLYSKVMLDISNGNYSFSSRDDGKQATAHGEVYAENCKGSLYTTTVIKY